MIDLMLIFNLSYELIEVMNHRSYKVNFLTKTKNLSLMCDRSYEVIETIDFSEDQMFGRYNYNCNWKYKMS